MGTPTFPPEAPADDAAAVAAGEDGKFAARYYKKWLQTRAGEWAATAELVDVWKATCEARFGRVPQPNHMSIQELEETLIVVGDEEVEGIKAGTETMYDGTVARFMLDKSQGYGEAFACFIDCPAFEMQVYCHRTHLNGLKEGDQVRLATHLNAKGQAQVSFIDRLNNRAVDPRYDTRIVNKGKGKGMKGGPKGGKGFDGGWGMPAAEPMYMEAP